MSEGYNQYLRPPLTGYDELRALHPDLFLYASIGARFGNQLIALDYAGMSLLTRIASVTWRVLDAFLTDLDPILTADASVGLGELRGAWRALWLAAVMTVPRVDAHSGLSLTGSGAYLLATSERDFLSHVDIPGQDWLERGTTLLLSINEREG